MCKMLFCEIWHSFSQAPMKDFLWCYYTWLIASLALEKCKKEYSMLQIILVQGFCPLKIRITQFPGGSIWNVITEAWSCLIRHVHNVSSYYKALLNRFSSNKSGTFSSNFYQYHNFYNILFTQKNTYKLDWLDQ